ncbi:hypothetical protein PIB30_009632 [Stylosanthes scabra]|uniref:Uncharacterized protein n=1 Tax=Stylosanthes scabra TaxID=79078 RepID=A0ABU6S4R4_9FABA|nr:hypothetical protein [Stylosanthes scabra]
MDSEEQQQVESYWSKFVDSIFKPYNEKRTRKPRDFWLEQVEGLKHYPMAQQSTGNANKISNSGAKVQNIPEHMAQRMVKEAFKNEGVRRAYDYRGVYFQGDKIHESNIFIGKFAVLASVLDGCCVLELLEKSDNSVDPEKELQISIDKLVRVHQDLLILDNQIPFQLLKLLCQDEARLEKCLHNFLQVHGIQTTPKLLREKTVNDTVNITLEEDHEEEEQEPLHLPDYLRRALLIRDQATFYKDINIKRRRSLHLRKYRIGTIRELKAAGIRVAKYSGINSIFPNFIDGVLVLPELIVDGSAAHIFLNLVAYEMCPDFRNSFEISSFLVFMSSLIDQPEDVKELRMAGIIINELANEKQVADLFNKMDTILVPETSLFAHIRD